MPKVSVIIPLYNGKRFIKETLQSVFNQSYQDFEVIVVNDGSTDNPEDELKPYFSKIKYFVQQNSGCPAGAKNRGITESSGEYLAFLDQDDLWEEDKLKRQTEILDNNPNVGLVATNAVLFQDETKKQIGIFWRKAKKFLGPQEARKKLIDYNFILSSSTVMVRRDALDENRYFDERFKMMDDHELWYHIAKRWSFALISKPLIHYRLSNQNLTKNKYISFKDFVLFYEMRSQDKKLTKKEHQFVLRQKAMFNFHLANNCMASNNFEEAKEKYQELKKEGKYIGKYIVKIKTIEYLSRISPKMAGLALRINRYLVERGRSGLHINITV